MQHPIENLVNMTTDRIKSLIDVNTVVGKPIVMPDGRTIIPICKATFGLVSGGGEYGVAEKPDDKQDQPDQQDAQSAAKEQDGNAFAGGAASGVSITPVSFMIVTNDDIRLVPAERESSVYDELIDRLPQIISEIKKLIPEKKQTDEEAGDEGEVVEKKKFLVVEETIE